MTRDGRVALFCAGIGVLVSGAAVLASISVRDYDVTALVRMGESDPIAVLARADDPSFASMPEGHYDGIYFYAIARDPVAQADAHELIDRPAYRYGHPGYGWLAGILSLGSPRAIPISLLVVNLAGMAVAAAAFSALSVRLGWTPWAGLAASLNPGLIYATTVDTSEVIGAALLVAVLLAWVRDKWLWGAASAAALCFVKEPFVLVPVGLLLWEFTIGRRGRDLWIRALALGVGPVLFALWHLYLRSVFGEWPIAQAEDVLSIPPAGWVDTFRRAAELYKNGDDVQVGQAAIPLLAAIGGALIAGIVRALRSIRSRRFMSPVDPVFVLLTLVTFSVSWLAILYPKDLIRNAAIPLMLLPLVVASARDGKEQKPTLSHNG